MQLIDLPDLPADIVHALKEARLLSRRRQICRTEQGMFRVSIEWPAVFRDQLMSLLDTILLDAIHFDGPGSFTATFFPNGDAAIAAHLTRSKDFTKSRA